MTGAGATAAGVQAARLAARMAPPKILRIVKRSPLRVC
jgi:hypothetical protein